MKWNIDFINQKTFDEHVKQTIIRYDDLLKPYDLKKLNSNILDPVKLIFDKSVYNYTWEEILNNEIFRQRDKSNNNSIGFFHQNIFNYINGCTVPQTGWDVIYRSEKGIKLQLESGDTQRVKTIYVEMKNKHNTMNSASSARTYMNMQNQLLSDDSCACFLVEAIAKRSQNIKWMPTVGEKRIGHKLIRRVSIDVFYSIVTGDDQAFYKLCLQLPDSIKRVLEGQSDDIVVPKDTVYQELKQLSKRFKMRNEDLSIAMAVYMLGFSSYKGFIQLLPENETDTNKIIYKLYEWATGANAEEDILYDPQ